MSRTQRVGPVEGFWATVDDWAAEVVEPRRVWAYWGSRCRRVADDGRYLDVTGELDGALGKVRPRRDAVANRGLALPAEPDLRATLDEAGVAYREVTAARRYRWTGPALTPVLLELHTTPDEAVVEAWWEDVWAAWPTIRMGQESEATRPPRRARPIAQISRLLAALGHEPLRRPD